MLKNYKFQDYILQTLSPISNDSHRLVREVLEHTSHNHELVDQELEKFQNLCQSVNAEFAEYLPVAAKVHQMNDEIRQKYEDLQKIQKIQDDRVAELQDTVERYENLLCNTRTYSASMGSVLCGRFASLRMWWKHC
jgi:DNA repair exonuclease SbcCD ATPase subunit